MGSLKNCLELEEFLEKILDNSGQFELVSIHIPLISAISFAGEYNPSEVEIDGQLHYLTSTCRINMDSVRERFITMFTAHPFGLAGGCIGNGDCRMENVHVECGDVDRRKRNSEASTNLKLKVNFQLFVTFPKDSNSSLNSSTTELIKSIEDFLKRNDYDLEVDGTVLRLDHTKPLFVKSVRPLCQVGQVLRRTMCGEYN